jgi:Zn-dependent peptidase ImmA (M78 family)/transcriptional regulator with XRE-family HTH domain
MSQTFAERFKSARLLNGFSLQDLANLLEGRVSRQALHRYEKGEVIPDSEMIGLLSEKLNVRQDYFFRDTQISLGTIEYRKLKRMSGKEEQKVAEQTREYLSRYLELEEILHINTAFDHPLKDKKDNKVRLYKEVNAAANEVRHHWELGCDPIYNVAELLEDKGIKVVEIKADLAFDGLQTLVNGNIPVLAYNGIKHQKPDRIRFTLLHELGHLLLNIDQSLSHKEKETLCHQFASAMLLPEETIRKELGDHRNRLSLQELGNLKRQYGISIQAIAMRARAVGIVSESYISQFFFMMTHNGWRVNEPEDYDYQGKETTCRFEQLLYRALVEEQISISKAASLKNQTLADFRKENPVF